MYLENNIKNKIKFENNMKENDKFRDEKATGYISVETTQKNLNPDRGIDFHKG